MKNVDWVESTAAEGGYCSGKFYFYCGMKLCRNLKIISVATVMVCNRKP